MTRSLLQIGVAIAVAGAFALGASPAARADTGAELTLAIAARQALSDLGNRPASFLDGPVIPDDWEKDDWDWVENGDAIFAPSGGHRSPLRAVGASFLLPGLGERYVEHGRRSNVFLAAEAAIWSAWAFYRIQGEQRESRHEEFAVLQGGAAAQQDGDYYEHIGLWLSIDEWHEIVRRDARFRFPDDPAAQEAFFEKNKRYEESQSWDWSDDDTRLRYRQLRSRSGRSFRNARFAVGLAVFNRFASAIDALALTRSYNARLDEERATLELRIVPTSTHDGLVIGPVLSTRY
jgi:hypothetical protein